jgi:uncharacterized protein (DUF362 family)
MMKRRDFIKYNLWGTIWMLAGSGLFMPKKLMADDLPYISRAKGMPGPATRAAVELLGGMKNFVKPGQTVVIKPNMSFQSPPERASNTHPQVVAELARMCKEAGATKILVLDNTLDHPERCLEGSGIREACRVIDKNMVYAVDSERLFKKVKIPAGKAMRSTEIMKDVIKADVLIAAPVAKTHSGAGVSLSMKGMMGLIYHRMVMHHYDLHTSIVDLCTVLKADLTVIDATRVLSTNGPHGPGLVLQENTVIASKDMVAADAYTVASFEWYGRRYKPRQVRHIREAHKRGLGRMDIENLNIKTVTL